MPTPAEIILSKIPLPTSLDSAGIRERWAADIRRRALFSARMASESHLKDLRRVLVAYAEGNINAAEARERLRFKLQALGLDGGTHALTDPGSLRRLNLILQTQRKMAASVARLQARDPDELEDWPAWRLERYGSRHVPRDDWSARWQAAGQSVGWQGAHRRQLVALKTSPIWQALGDGAGGFKDTLGNPYPPFAYGSGMDWTDVDADEAKRLGLEPDGSLPNVSLAPSDQEVARAVGRSGVLDHLTVANSVCHAKNPATCRIHGSKPGHGQREPETKARDRFGSTDERLLAANPKRREERAQAAFKNIMDSHKSVDKAVYREEVGWVRFDWGDLGNPKKEYEGGHGLSHMAAKHEKDLKHLPAVLAYGDIYEHEQDGKLYVVLGSRFAVLASLSGGNKKTITEYEPRNPEAIERIKKNPKRKRPGQN